MTLLIVLFRAAQLFAHAAHNSVTGPAFFGDHAFFGDSYAAFEKAYDALVEQEIARGAAPDLAKINIDGTMISAAMALGNAEALFKGQQALELRIRTEIATVVESADDAGQSLLQALAQDSLDRSYKIGQRLAV